MHHPPSYSPDGLRAGADRSAGTFAIATPSPGVRLIRASGVLGPDSAARLLRLVDAQLMLARCGDSRLRAVIVDVSALQALGRGGPEALTHARHACARLGVEFLLVGHPDDSPFASLWVRRRLGVLRRFPTVDAALAALPADPAGGPGHVGTSGPSALDDVR